MIYCQESLWTLLSSLLHLGSQERKLPSFPLTPGSKRPKWYNSALWYVGAIWWVRRLDYLPSPSHQPSTPRRVRNSNWLPQREAHSALKLEWSSSFWACWSHRPMLVDIHAAAALKRNLVNGGTCPSCSILVFKWKMALSSTSWPFCITSVSPPWVAP